MIYNIKVAATFACFSISYRFRNFGLRQNSYTLIVKLNIGVLTLSAGTGRRTCISRNQETKYCKPLHVCPFSYCELISVITIY